MKLKTRIPIVSIILVALAAVPIVYTQTIFSLWAEEPIVVSAPCPTDETAHATLVVREAPLEMTDYPQSYIGSIYDQWLEAMMATENSVFPDDFPTAEKTLCEAF